ncbi:MAG: ABC transporter ATP-binding protein [Tepidanaerobacteraceae bacterium]|jgi:branched-chain amino acid transport system ATP-binding protein|nr:ABC transporter ATP-binding protein [Tepidanaerobacteraceae bacterium]
MQKRGGIVKEILKIANLTKKFGGVCAIDNFSVTLEEGTVHGLIGPNGAGKTTIFNTITGIYKPTGGTIEFMGKDITNKKPYQVAQQGIGRTFQNIRLFSQLSVLENVFIAGHMDADYDLFAAILRLNKFGKKEKYLRENCIELLKILGLSDKLNEKAGSLPYGHQRKLEIARALALRPKLLLLDEPAAGMNRDESKELVEFINELKEKFKLTILMVEHHMDVVMSICRRITVLNFGKTIAEGTAKEIQTNKLVREAYLGGEDAAC